MCWFELRDLVDEMVWWMEVGLDVAWSRGLANQRLRSKDKDKFHMRAQNKWAWALGFARAS